MGETARHREAGLRALPYGVLAVVATVDIVAGSAMGFVPLVSLGPAFGGLVGGRRRTAGIGALAFAVCLGLIVYDGMSVRRGITALATVTGVTAAAMLAAALRQRRETELARVRSIAEVTQRVLLRPVPRVAGHLRAAVSYNSAVAEARVGGDLYEVVVSPYGVRMIMGDVQGKGLEAVETAAAVLAAFREAAYEHPDLTRVGAQLERSAARVLSGEEFVTAVLAEARPDIGISFLNYGHPPPMVVRADGRTEFVDPPEPAPPLGLGLAGTDPPKPHVVPFAPGDQVLLYTDGVTEARDDNGAFYPLAERHPLLRTPDPDGALDALVADLDTYAPGPRHDDAALLLLRHRMSREG